MSNAWYAELDTKIFTILKTKLNKKFLSKKPNLVVTNSDRNTGVAKFPNVYIQALSFSERGQDLDGLTVNAMLVSYQISVSSNVSQEEVTDVISECIEIVKAMRFEIAEFPRFDNIGEVYVARMRIKRVIGANDAL